MTGISFINLLAALLVISSLLVVLSKTIVKAAKLYALQSLILVALFIALAYVMGSKELYLWSCTAFITKVLLVPAMLLVIFKKMGSPELNYESKLTPLRSIVLTALELIVCFILVKSIKLPTALEVYPALAISLGHFFIGLSCIITQRNIFKQILGYCLMENGSHLTLALLAPAAPELVEIGIATDAIFAVLIMALVAWRIYRTKESLDANDLMELKG